MSNRLTLDDVARMPEHVQRQVGAQYYEHRVNPPHIDTGDRIGIRDDGLARAVLPALVKPSKYGNRKTVVDGIRFDSKREADYYCKLKLELAEGRDLIGFTRQVSMTLSTIRRRIRLDFVENRHSGLRWVDAKGYATESWNLKRDLIEAQLGIKIELV